MANYSIDTIWYEFGDKLKGFINNRISDEMIAEDILQDVFVKIHSGIGKLKDDTRLQSWIYQITRNTITDHYRSRKFKHQLHEEVPDDSGTPGPSAMQRIAAGLEGMVQLLPEKYREALLLTEFQGMSQVALAKKLGISISGAKSRVQRARQMLKDMLLECCHFEFDRRGTIIDYHPHSCSCCSRASTGNQC